MGKLNHRKAHSPGRKHNGYSRIGNKVSMDNPPMDLASLIRGLYHRVAEQLGVDPSYVSRVARDERQSEAVKAALRRELGKIVDSIHKRGFAGARKISRKKTKSKK